jgi:hypothetical protein
MPEVANLGIVRPPFVYLGAIALGLLLHVAWTVQLVSCRKRATRGTTSRTSSHPREFNTALIESHLNP